MIVRPVRYINPQHPLLEGHLNFISHSHSLTLSIASPFPYLTLYCTIVSYHMFLQDKLGSVLPPSELLTSVGWHYRHTALPNIHTPYFPCSVAPSPSSPCPYICKNEARLSTTNWIEYPNRAFIGIPECQWRPPGLQMYLFLPLLLLFSFFIYPSRLLCSIPSSYPHL